MSRIAKPYMNIQQHKPHPRRERITQISHVKLLRGKYEKYQQKSLFVLKIVITFGAPFNKIEHFFSNNIHFIT